MLDGVLARRLRVVGLDVDGVLSDGGLYIGAIGGQKVELKRFDSQDGAGAWLLRRAGLALVFASGRHADATTIRARELHVDEVIEDPGAAGQKLGPFEAMLARRGVGWSECAFVGDDLADLPLLTRAALPIAVANAVPEVKAVARFVTSAAGGHGAVREIAEALLKARGVWNDVLREYLAERGNVQTRAG